MKLSGTKSVDNLRAYRRPLDDCKNAQTSAAPMADGRAPPPSEGRGFPAHRQQHASALHGGRQDHLPQGRVCRAGDRSSPALKSNYPRISASHVTGKKTAHTSCRTQLQLRAAAIERWLCCIHFRLLFVAQILAEGILHVYDMLSRAISHEEPEFVPHPRGSALHTLDRPIAAEDAPWTPKGALNKSPMVVRVEVWVRWKRVGFDESTLVHHMTGCRPHPTTTTMLVVHIRCALCNADLHSAARSQELISDVPPIPVNGSRIRCEGGPSLASLWA
eukprot:472586-Rhodomonas_salina.3